MSDLEQEYERVSQLYKQLEILVSMKTAGTLDKNFKCPDELLKRHLIILRSYKNDLEERLKYD